MRRIDWYRNALMELGLGSLIRLQLHKKFFRKKLSVLTSKRLAAPVFARPGTSDFAVFDQMFVERQYAPLDNIEGIKLVLDCGANVGFSSAYFLSAYPESFVIAVEPEQSNYELLTKNLLPYENRIRTVKAAVWPAHQKLRLQTAASPGNEWGHTVGPAGDEGNVQSVTIPDLIEIGGFARVSLLKLDIEGAERYLFEGSTEWLKLVDNIVIELHGADCELAFFRAIENYQFRICRSGELTVCLSELSTRRV